MINFCREDKVNKPSKSKKIKKIKKSSYPTIENKLGVNDVTTSRGYTMVTSTDVTITILKIMPQFTHLLRWFRCKALFPLVIMRV